MNSQAVNMNQRYVGGGSAHADFSKPQFTEPSHYRMVAEDDDMNDFLEDLDSDEEVGGTCYTSLSANLVEDQECKDKMADV